MAWAALLHVAGAHAAEGALRRLRASNKAREAVVALLRDLPPAQGISALAVADQKLLLRRNGPELVDLVRVVALAGDGDLAAFDRLREMRATFTADTGPAGLDATPLIGGRDLREAGIQPGPDYGRVLLQVERAQLEGRVTTREEALALALELIS